MHEGSLRKYWEKTRPDVKARGKEVSRFFNYEKQECEKEDEDFQVF